MLTFLRGFRRNQAGAIGAEYALIIAMVSMTAAAGMAILGNAIVTSMERSANHIEGPPDAG